MAECGIRRFDIGVANGNGVKPGQRAMAKDCGGRSLLAVFALFAWNEPMRRARGKYAWRRSCAWRCAEVDARMAHGAAGQRQPYQSGKGNHSEDCDKTASNNGVHGRLRVGIDELAVPGCRMNWRPWSTLAPRIGPQADLTPLRRGAAATSSPFSPVPAFHPIATAAAPYRYYRPSRSDWRACNAAARDNHNRCSGPNPCRVVAVH